MSHHLPYDQSQSDSIKDTQMKETRHIKIFVCPKRFYHLDFLLRSFNFIHIYGWGAKSNSVWYLLPEVRFLWMLTLMCFLSLSFSLWNSFYWASVNRTSGDWDFLPQWSTLILFLVAFDVQVGIFSVAIYRIDS